MLHLVGAHLLSAYDVFQPLRSHGWLLPGSSIAQGAYHQQAPFVQADVSAPLQTCFPPTPASLVALNPAIILTPW